ncbi:hypothetical protein RY831_27655 [Noviherbaspirillum sp. CPCC 100848]|uniref:Phage protein Gp138 N-terminal domain-containing protein n=1 Tax=Noviherbaspirillum album TaxID=3080276 RepID=A0ABU6JHD5_9BURK|nr:hypothetical protein [Noviherbaspirillum sp. CPCC 100848]MEC4722940.1 hypothetical protein [Noviherbaspirillum sp. CPCC 100848]
MQQFIQAVTAGKPWQLQTMGDYFRLVACPLPVDVKFFRANQEIASAVQMDTGFYLKPAGGFDRIEVVSAQAQTIKIMVLDGDGGYDRFNVDVTSALQAIAVNISGAAEMTVKQAATINNIAPVAVGTAQTLLVAADATRRGLRFTNNGSSVVYIGGNGVTVANGAIAIGAGQTWIEDQAAPGAWYGISGVAGQQMRIQEIK